MVLWAGEPTASDQIVAFARSQVGRQVGDGQCSSLAVAAMRHAGARLRRDAEVPWGEEVPALRDVRPGDILQFEGVVFVRHRALPEGGLVTTTLTYPHHTAIVVKIRKRGPRPILEILHQNVGMDGGDDSRRKVVQEGVLNFAEKRRGTVKVYRPSVE
jgi:hypothetical protein